VAIATVVIPVAVHAAEDESETMERAVHIEAEAIIAAIDLETREVSLRVDGGFMFTAVVPEDGISLDEFSVGDRVIGTYTAAVEAELREPTEEELADPWKVLEEGFVSKEGDAVTVGEAQLVRAVVTIDGVNKEQGVVIVTDSRGMIHMIGDVEPDKLTDVSAGQKAVIVFTESMALSLKKA